MSIIAQWNERLSRFVWGPAMLALLIGTGVYLSVRTGMFQFTHFGSMLRETLGGIFARREKRSKQSITPFQAMSTALAGTMGVGNITGVATAISLGGAGAIFWMWVSAIFGMMTKFAEVALAVRYRETARDGLHRGGPMLYLSRGLHSPVLAWIFSLLCVAASFGIGNMAQANAVSGAMLASFSVPLWVSGVAVAAVVGLIILGGLRRIAAITELVVPLMSVLYIAFALVVIVQNRQAVPAALCDIVGGAFAPRPVLGGCGGYTIARAMRYGFARGVFSNEAGLGSAPIAHAAADTDNPVRQGMWGIFEVFADTIVCCTLTALVLLTSGVFELPIESGAMTSAAFSMGLGSFGGQFVAVSLVFFAVSSMLGWCYYGESCLGFLTGYRSGAVLLYRWAFILCIPVGAVARLAVVWSISDTLNGLMVLPNLIGVLGLSGVVISMVRDYSRKR